MKTKADKNSTEIFEAHTYIQIHTCTYINTRIYICYPCSNSASCLYSILRFERGVLIVGWTFIASGRRYTNFNAGVQSLMYKCLKSWRSYSVHTCANALNSNHLHILPGFAFLVNLEAFAQFFLGVAVFKNSSVYINTHTFLYTFIHMHWIDKCIHVTYTYIICVVTKTVLNSTLVS